MMNDIIHEHKLKGWIMKCPICKSKDINQYRMPTGRIWCMVCGFKEDYKEINNPFEEDHPLQRDEKLQHFIKKVLDNEHK